MAECIRCGRTVAAKPPWVNVPVGRFTMTVRPDAPHCLECGRNWVPNSEQWVWMHLVTGYQNELVPADSRPIRKALGLSKADWARLMVVPVAYLRRIEQEEIPADLRYTVRVASFCLDLCNGGGGIA